MEAFAWTDRFVTGLEEVDRQHRGLVDLVNRVGLLAEGELAPSAQETRAILDQLVRYTVEHFTAEERLMEAALCDARHVSFHKAAHGEFVRQIGLMNRSLLADGAGSLDALFKFLASWLAYHILGADHSMARQIHAIHAGTSPAEAYEREVPMVDRGSAMLLEALGHMVNLIASRNLVLAETQEMLQRANAGLETKVEARTRDLEHSNAELSAMVKRLEEAQNQLLQSEKMASIGQLAAGVAHEINNPVGFVNSNLGTLKIYVASLLELVAGYEAEEGALPAAARTRLAAIKARADLEYLRHDIIDLVAESRDGLDRVTRIVQDLKEFSRVDHAEWQLADLNKGMDSTLNVAWNEIKYKAEVVKEYGELPPVMCLPAQLNQVFLNLLVNAAQAIDEKGTIRLRSGVEGDRVWVEVTDTGKGMSAEVQRRIFEPFYTTKPVGQGTGLGLSLAYGIVDKHGGRIEVRSAPGKGSTFRVWLPVAQAVAEAAAAA